MLGKLFCSVWGFLKPQMVDINMDIQQGWTPSLTVIHGDITGVYLITPLLPIFFGLKRS